MDVVSALHGRVTFVVGSQKNAGKTTFLNWAARQLRTLGPVALVSVGVDGEARDLVFGNPKPRVPVEAGDFVLTTDGAIRSSHAFFRILDVFPGSTVLGRLVLAQVVRGDTVELIGPETNGQLAEIILALKEYGAKSILVDGAVNRVTQVASATAEPASVVDVVRLIPANARAVEERLRMLSLVLDVPQCPDGDLPEGWVEVPGALTSSRIAALPRDRCAVVIPDFSCLFVDTVAIRGLGCPLYFRKVFSHSALVLNAFDVNEIEFLKASRMSDKLKSRVLLNPCKEFGA